MQEVKPPLGTDAMHGAKQRRQLANARAFHRNRKLRAKKKGPKINQTTTVCTESLYRTSTK